MEVGAAVREGTGAAVREGIGAAVDGLGRAVVDDGRGEEVDDGRGEADVVGAALGCGVVLGVCPGEGAAVVRGGVGRVPVGAGGTTGGAEPMPVAAGGMPGETGCRFVGVDRGFAVPVGVRAVEPEGFGSGFLEGNGKGLVDGRDRIPEREGTGRGVPPPDDTRAQIPKPPPTASTAAPPAIQGAFRAGRRCRFMILTVQPIADGLNREPGPALRRRPRPPCCGADERPVRVFRYRRRSSPHFVAA
ncbi:hypothetical protein ACWCQK_33560 [Streptomyces sp. NPDC002306]